MAALHQIDREKEAALTFERAHELLSYDVLSGRMFWRVDQSPNIRAGDIAGPLHPKSYLIVCIDGRLYAQHRVVWFMLTGSWPKDQIDHINGIRFDNRIENLREATQAQNSRNRPMNSNNPSGFKGVSRYGKSWKAQIGINGKRIDLGNFPTPEAAHAAYAAAAKEHHGEFARAR